MIIGFNVRPAAGGRARAREGVDIRDYSIIYQAIEEIEAALKGMLKPEFEEAQLGTAEVRELFKVPRVGTVAAASSAPDDHPQQQGANHPRRRGHLRQPLGGVAPRFKDDATEVREGYECGIGVGYNDIRIEDVIETFEMREKPRGPEPIAPCRS